MVQDRRYLDADIGVETEDLTFFRTLAKLHNVPLEWVIDASVRIGADALRSGAAKLVVPQVPR